MIRALFLISVLAACGPMNYDPARSNSETNSIKVWIDPSTGCRYFVSTRTDFMTPQLDKNGRVICN